MNLVPKKFLRKFASAMLLAVALKYDCFASCLVFGLITYKVQNDAYDPIGNRLSASHNAATYLYSANSLNQYTSISNLCTSVPPHEGTNPVNPVNPVQESPAPPSAFAYDADGNMTADERGWRYVWNGENRMICASNSEYVVTYAYDHRGRMVRKEISHEGTETRSIAYLWDDWNIIREIVRKGDSVAITDNIWGLDIDGTLQGAGGVGGLLAVQRSDCAATNSAFCILHSALFFPTYDANGNITEYVTANGTVAAHYEYSGFGEPVVAAGELAATFTHQFSTKPYCAVTGFNEYVYRKYRPEIGRWMSRDPLEELGGFGLYIFALNNGIEFVDLLGNACETFEGTWRLGPNSGLFFRTSVCTSHCPEKIEASVFVAYEWQPPALRAKRRLLGRLLYIEAGIHVGVEGTFTYSLYANFGNKHFNRSYEWGGSYTTRPGNLFAIPSFAIMKDYCNKQPKPDSCCCSKK